MTCSYGTFYVENAENAEENVYIIFITSLKHVFLHEAQSIDSFPYCTCNLTNLTSTTCSKLEPRELQVCVDQRDSAL